MTCHGEDEAEGDVDALCVTVARADAEGDADSDSVTDALGEPDEMMSVDVARTVADGDVASDALAAADAVVVPLGAAVSDATAYGETDGSCDVDGRLFELADDAADGAGASVGVESDVKLREPGSGNVPSVVGEDRAERECVADTVRETLPVALAARDGDDEALSLADADGLTESDGDTVPDGSADRVSVGVTDCESLVDADDERDTLALRVTDGDGDSVAVSVSPAEAVRGTVSEIDALAVADVAADREIDGVSERVALPDDVSRAVKVLLALCDASGDPDGDDVDDGDSDADSEPDADGEAEADADDEDECEDSADGVASADGAAVSVANEAVLTADAAADSDAQLAVGDTELVRDTVRDGSDVGVTVRAAVVVGMTRSARPTPRYSRPSAGAVEIVFSAALANMYGSCPTASASSALGVTM